jgi:uncharacterized protein YgiM (DUF1202 family)
MFIRFRKRILEEEMMDKVKKRSQRFVSTILVLGLASSLSFGMVSAPVYAQAVDGTLVDIGEGDSRILTTDWQTLSSGQQVTYQVAYDGNEEPITIAMNTVPAASAVFQVWTSERLDDLSTNPDTQPLGQGTPPTDDPGYTTWVGASPEAETYFVVVSPTGDETASYLLSISSPALALVQPGAVAAEPVTPTVSLDPNIATVTTDALNVRSGPSTAFPVLTTIPNGTQMTVLGRNPANTWLNVQLEDGTEGWVTRSLTSYTLVSPNVVTPSLLPVVAANVAATVTTTSTAPVTTTSTVTATNGITTTELGDDWQVLSNGETDWFSFQYRGGNLPLTIWMDLEPFNQAQFTVVNAETFQAMLDGTAPTPLPVVGSGLTNPVQPGYLYWQADFPEADTYYVMVAPTRAANGSDVLYSINALGPGVARGIEPEQ